MKCPSSSPWRPATSPTAPAAPAITSSTARSASCTPATAAPASATPPNRRRWAPPRSASCTLGELAGVRERRQAVPGQRRPHPPGDVRQGLAPGGQPLRVEQDQVPGSNLAAGLAEVAERPDTAMAQQRNRGGRLLV